jgi:integrase
MATTKTIRNKPAKSPASALSSTPLLSADQLGAEARRAAEEILIAGQAENTLKSYRSALRYWAAWAHARYGKPIALPVLVPVVVQFIVDHLARGRSNAPVCELPKDIDELMVVSGFKGHLGPMKMNTVVHRIAVLSKLHQMRRQPNPCEDPEVRHLLSRAKRAASKRGETVTKKTAATREPLEAMLATCDESLEGIRDRAILLFGWSSGGRRRSEVADACIEHLTKVGDSGFLFKLVRSKTNQDGNSAGAVSVDKPIRGIAARALNSWLTASGISEGPLFRRLWKTRVGPALSPAAVAEVVRRRALMAGLEGDWAGHSLRSGFITEAGRKNIPIGDVMAMTEHRKVDTVLGYYRSGELGNLLVSGLLDN